MKNSISILIPAYNEEKLLSATIKELLAYLKSIPDITYEIIICDNGSTDKTKEVGKHLANNRNVIYAFTPTKGFGAAIKLGARIASKRITLFLPADGEIDLQFIADCVAKFKEKSIIIGCRKNNLKRSSNLFRYILSTGFSILVKLCFSFQLDEVGTVKAFETGWLHSISDACAKTDFSWQIEIIYHAMKAKLNIIKIPVGIIKKRDSSESKVNILSDTISLGSTCIKYGFLLRMQQILGVFSFKV